MVGTFTSPQMGRDAVGEKLAGRQASRLRASEGAGPYTALQRNIGGRQNAAPTQSKKHD